MHLIHLTAKYLYIRYMSYQNETSNLYVRNFLHEDEPSVLSETTSTMLLSFIVITNPNSNINITWATVFVIWRFTAMNTEFIVVWVVMSCNDVLLPSSVWNVGNLCHHTASQLQYIYDMKDKILVAIINKCSEFFSSPPVNTGSTAKVASYTVGTGSLSSWVKRPGREADHSPPSSVEVKNAWSYTSTPPYVFMV
jgi:hypothetical protein